METKYNIEDFHRLWKTLLISVKNKYEAQPVVLTVAGSTISTLGNFSASTGKGKSKKTFNVCAIVAAAISGQKVLNYEAHFPEGKRRILYFDTEQSSYHCQKVLRRINMLAGLSPDQDCEMIEFVKLRELGPLERRQVIDMAMAEHSDIGLVIIDGLRDLLFDINSSTEASDVIGLLMKWTSYYNLHVHTVLHLNKGDDNVRGHIGTELINKAETVLQITKNEFNPGISHVKATMLRDKDFAPFAFRINDDDLPELVTGVVPDSDDSKQSAFDPEKLSWDAHSQALDVAFDGVEQPILYTALLARLVEGYKSIMIKRGKNTHKKTLQYLLKINAIQKQDKGYCYNEGFLQEVEGDE